MTPIDYSSLDLMDALDLAVFIETEAQERYEEFVATIGGRYPGDAADIFATMAKNEATHRQQLLERRQTLFGKTPVRVTREMIWDVEAPDPGRPRTFMSAYQAMEVALEGEIKAHQFFLQAIPLVNDPVVKGLFEELCNEELSHQRLLHKWMEGHQAEKFADRDDEDLDEPSSL